MRAAFKHLAAFLLACFIPSFACAGGVNLVGSPFPPQQYKIMPQPGKVMLGIWANPALGTQPVAIASREASIGRTFNIHTQYFGWNRLQNIHTDATVQDDEANSRYPLISWGCPSAGVHTITNGSQDALLHATAAAVKAEPTLMFIRWWWEANLNYNNPGGNANGNNCYDLPATETAQAAQEVAAWQYIINLFNADGVNNVTWVWCPAVSAADYAAHNIDALYPGDGFIDWKCGDTYLKPAQPIQTFVGIWDDAGNGFWTMEHGKGKPLMIGETASANDNMSYTQTNFLNDAATALQPGGAFYASDTDRIAALCYFDSDVAQNWSLGAPGLGTLASAGALPAFNPLIQRP